MKYKTIQEIKQANKEAGNFFFSPNNMRFFNSCVLNKVYNGKYFITSEKGPNNIRAFTIHMITEDGKIQVIGEFQQYKTAQQAKIIAERLK